MNQHHLNYKLWGKKSLARFYLLQWFLWLVSQAIAGKSCYSFHLFHGGGGGGCHTQTWKRHTIYKRYNFISIAYSFIEGLPFKATSNHSTVSKLSFPGVKILSQLRPENQLRAQPSYWGFTLTYPSHDREISLSKSIRKRYSLIQTAHPSWQQPDLMEAQQWWPKASSR